jgi:signal transduction histidine kinase
MLEDEKITDGAPSPSSTPAFSLRKSAHDLRNALNIMRNAGYLLRRKLVAAGSEHVDLVDMIEESVKSAETIATQMMDHAALTGEPPASRSTPRPK